MSVRETPESGLRVDRIGVIREEVTGDIPADPSWEYHSDNYLNFTWGPSPSPQRRDELGSPDPSDWDVGNQEHELTVAYSQQRPVVDTNGNPDGFVADGLMRDSANRIPNTHALLAREFRPAAPDDPSDVDGARTYTVMKGGYPDPSLEGDPDTGEPVPTELTYTAEKVRSLEILQPSNDTLLVAESTSSEDTDQSLTVEDEGASQTGTINLDGTNLASTTASFPGVDAAELSAETVGDVILSINDGDETSPTKGTELATIRGGLFYSPDDQPLEGDLGVPALGAGSHATELSTTFEHFIGDSVQRNSEGLAFDLNNVTFEVGNNYDTTPRADSTRYRITEGNRDVTMSADVVGHRATHRHIMDSLGTVGSDLIWTLSQTEITVNGATITAPPERTRENEDAAASISVEFGGKGDPAIGFTNVA